MRKLWFAAVLLGLSSAALAAPVALKIDPEHSSVGFSVRHLFTRVNGSFREFSGTIAFDEGGVAASKVSASIRAKSIDTNSGDRDKDLRSPRFFDAEKYPDLTFESRKIVPGAGGRFSIEGILTMHGVSRPVVLDAEFLGKGKDPYGNLLYGFRATTTVNRKDFGMQWNAAVETGGVLVGDDVEITLDVEATPEAS